MREIHLPFFFGPPEYCTANAMRLVVKKCQLKQRSLTHACFRAAPPHLPPPTGGQVYKCRPAGPTGSVLPSPMTSLCCFSHTRSLVHCAPASLSLLRHARHVPPTDTLHLLFPLPEMLFPQHIHKVGFLLSYRSALKTHFLIDAFSGHLN